MYNYTQSQARKIYHIQKKLNNNVAKIVLEENSNCVILLNKYDSHEIAIK